MLRQIVAASLAGAVGTLINAFAVAVFVSLDKISLALVPGRYGVAIALCLALPVLSNLMPARAFYPVGLGFLTIGASLLAKLVFLAQAPWGMVLAFNLVYAIAALVTYWVIVRRIAPERAARVRHS